MRDFGVWRRREEIFAGVSSGLLAALSFAPFPTRFLSLVALVPIVRYFLAMSHAGGTLGDRVRAALALGFAFGISFFTALLYWILDLIPESGVTVPWLMGPALVLLVLYLSCYPALFAVAQSLLARRFGSASLVAFPALWTLSELARSHGELGFSWGILSYSLAIHPMAIQSLAVYGPFGLSFVLATCNLLAALALFGKGGRRRIAPAAALAVIVAAHLAWGAAELGRWRGVEAAPGAPEVAVVQPNTDLAMKWDPAKRDSLFNQIESFVAGAARHDAELVIFPETAAPVSFKISPQYLRRLEGMALSSGVDILTGYVDHEQVDGEWKPQNAAALISREGFLAGNYHKINLLPFGEKMPWSQYFPVLRKLDFGQANFIAGKDRTIFDSAAGKFGVLICFESTFAGYTRRYVRDGAQFLVNITNDGWFGGSVGPVQHAEMAVFRAVENRVTLFRSAYTGVSMIVAPSGRVTARLGMFTAGTLFGSVSPARRLTFYTQYGNLACFLMLLASPFVMLLVRRNH